MDSLRRTSATAIGWTSIAALSRSGLQLLSFIILARFFLTPEEFGVAALAFAFVELAIVLRDAGLNQALIHHQNTTLEEESSVFWMSALVGCILFIIVASTAGHVANFFDAPKVEPLVQILALQFVLFPWGAQFEALLARDLKFRVVSIIETISFIVVFSTCVTAAWMGLGAVSIAIGALAGVLTRTTFFLSVGLPRYPIKLWLRLRDLSRIVKFSGFYLADKIVNALSQRLDQIVLGRFLGTEALGYYNVAYWATAMPVAIANPIVTRVAFPVFARIQHEQARLRNGYIEVCQTLAVVNAPITLGLLAVAPVAVPLVFGPQWSPVTPLLQLLGLVALLRSLSNPVGVLLLATGKTNWAFYWNVGVLSIIVPTVIIGALLNGAIGVASGLLLAQLGIQVPFYYLLIRRLIGPCALAYSWAVAKPIIMAGIMALIVLLIGYLSPVALWITLPAQILLGSILYSSLVAYFMTDTLKRNLNALPANRATLIVGKYLDRFERQ